MRQKYEIPNLFPVNHVSQFFNSLWLKSIKKRLILTISGLIAENQLINHFRVNALLNNNAHFVTIIVPFLAKLMSERRFYVGN